VERHNLFVSLAPGVEHLQSVEPPPLNVQRCYVHIEDDHESRAWAVAGKSPVIVDQSKKGAKSTRANESPEDSTRKRCRMVRDWAEDEEDDASAYMLNPRKKRSEQTRQEAQTPPVGPTPNVMAGEERAGLPPQDEGQGSSAPHTSEGQPQRRAFNTIHRSSDM
jgi:hypothetical protein